MTSKPQSESQLAHIDQSLIVSDIRRLQHDVDDLKSRPNNPWQKLASSLGVVGGLLGILSALVTFPKSLHDTLISVHPEANFKYESQMLILRYDPIHPAYYLTIPIYIRNDGSAIDTLEYAQGHLTYSPVLASGSSDTINTQGFDAGPGDFKFYDKPDQSEVIPLPIQIGSNEGKLILVSINFDNMTFAKQGQNSLEVNLTTGSHTKYRLQYCFYLDDQLLEELKDNVPPAGNTFRTPQC